MNTFNNVQKEAMNKYMDAFIELAKLVPDIEQTDIYALQNLSMYVKDNRDLAPEVADGYAAVYNRVHDMIFTGNVNRIPYAEPITLARDNKLNSLEFDTFKKATNFYDTIVDHISKYGSITVKDVIDEYDKIYNTDDYTPNFYDSKCGWTSLPSKDVIVRYGRTWTVHLPYPAAIN